ncbi:MAG: hypothetical protein L7U87_04225 [Chlamydiales bacterium]|nr:hypothetical protein [Chlamydiales bacterium]
MFRHFLIFFVIAAVNTVCALSSNSELEQLLESKKWGEAQKYIEDQLAKIENKSHRARLSINLSIVLCRQSKWEEALEVLENDIFIQASDETQEKRSVTYAFVVINLIKKVSEHNEHLTDYSIRTHLEKLDLAQSNIQKIRTSHAKDLLKQLYRLRTELKQKQEVLKEQEFLYLKDKIRDKINFWRNLLDSYVGEDTKQELLSVHKEDLELLLNKMDRLKMLEISDNKRLTMLFQEFIEEAKQNLIEIKGISDPALAHQYLNQASYLFDVLPFSIDRVDPVKETLQKLLKQSKELSFLESGQLSSEYRDDLERLSVLLKVIKRVLNRSIRSLNSEDDLDSKDEINFFLSLRYRLQAVEGVEELPEQLALKTPNEHTNFLEKSLYRYNAFSMLESQLFGMLLDLLSVDSNSSIILDAIRVLKQKFHLRKEFVKAEEQREKIKEVLLTLDEVERDTSDFKRLQSLVKGAYLNWDGLSYLSYKLKTYSGLDKLSNNDRRDFWSDLLGESKSVLGMEPEYHAVLGYVVACCKLLSTDLYSSNSDFFSFEVSLSEQIVRKIHEEVTEHVSLKNLLEEIVEMQERVISLQSQVEVEKAYILQNITFFFSNYLNYSFDKEKDRWSLSVPFEKAIEVHAKAKQLVKKALVLQKSGTAQQGIAEQEEAKQLWLSLLKSDDSQKDSSANKDNPSEEGADSQQSNKDSEQTKDNQSSNSENEGDNQKEAKGKEEGSQRSENKPQEDSGKREQKRMDRNLKDIDNDREHQSYTWSNELLEEIKQMERDDAKILNKKRQKGIRKGLKPW